MGEIEKSPHNSYVSEQREEKANESHYDLVKKLLEKLPESERTIIILYYLGKMTTKDIANSLGVSVNTITSRLQSARKQLQNDQEHLIQEVLGDVHISTDLTGNIMKRVADEKSISSPNSKLLLLWIGSGITVGLIALFIATCN